MLATTVDFLKESGQVLPGMMKTTVSLFIRKFTPGDATSRHDVPFAADVRGGYDNPTLRAMHSIYITKNSKGVKKKYLTPMTFYSMIAKVHIA